MKVSELKEWNRNARTISEDAAEGLGVSIERFGDLSGIVFNRQLDALVCGHQRMSQIKGLLGGSDPEIEEVDDEYGEIAVGVHRFRVRFVDWDEATHASANVTANNMYIAGDFTDDIDQMLRELKTSDCDFDALKLDELADGLDVDLDAIEFTDPSEEPPSAPQPLPDTPVSKRGNLWLLGDHRLKCGDSTSEVDVESLLDGHVPFIMVTDPPYGVEYDPAWRNKAGISNTERTGVVKNDDMASWAKAYRLFQGAVAYVWHADKYASIVSQSLESCGFEIRSQIIWVKHRFALSRGQYHWRHEPCWYCVRQGATADWAAGRKEQTVWADIVDEFFNGNTDMFAGRVDADTLTAFDASQTTVWEISSNDGSIKTDHGTQKPVECMARPIRNHGGAHDDVYDPFCGSGTTIIACEQLNRRCFAMELDPRYADIIVKRWQEYTGKDAVLESSGQTFNELSEGADAECE